MSENRILITGATGYVGGKLLKRLENTGKHVNCLVRNPGKLQPSDQNTRVYQGDVFRRSSMWEAFQGVKTAYYLIHSLHDKHDFESHEIEAAENFAYMAKSAGVERIIYLGALGNESQGLSPHLQSRQDVGHALRSYGVDTLELRCSIVLGDGSLSFNMIRDLTEHLPFMVMPRWVSTKAQPIGIEDLIDYLVASLTAPISRSEIVEIGGADQMSYKDLMKAYAKARGIRRLMIPVPVLTPWLSSHWLALFTSVDAAVGRKLIEGIRNPTIVESNRFRQLFDIEPASAETAINVALGNRSESAHPPTQSMVMHAGGRSDVYAA
jgi:uncharacterized protein YbjT (DUF2867 family)